MRRYKIQENGIIPHYITWTITGWLPIFVSHKYYDILTESLKYCRLQKSLLVHAYVIMPTHAHLTLSVQQGGDLVAVLRDSRKFIAKEIVRQLKQDGNSLFDWAFRDAARKQGRPEGSYAVWQPGGHPEVIMSSGFARQKVDYLHDNPVRKGLVWRPEDWRYSSAGQYATGEAGPLEVDVLEF